MSNPINSCAPADYTPPLPNPQSSPDSSTSQNPTLRRRVARAVDFTMGGAAAPLPNAELHISPFKKRVFEADPAALGRSMQQVKRALKEDPTTILSPTAHGGSGFTFLGSTTAKHIFTPQKTKPESPHPDTPVRFVLKWVTQLDAANELACTNLSHAYGLDVPAMQKLGSQVASLFVSPTKNAKPAFSPEPFQLLLMNRVPGVNLFELCLNGTVCTLSTESWEQLMQSFGYAAIFDLFIGNVDRFVRFQTNSEGEYILSPNPQANPGNVMLEATPEKKQSLARISFIDNGTPLIQEERPPETTGISNNLALLFDSDRSQSSEAASALPFSSTAQGKKVVPALNQAFAQMIEIEKNQPSELVAHITKSVFNALKNVLITQAHWNESDMRLLDLFCKIESTQSALQAGLMEGQSRLLDSEFQEKARQISAQGTKDFQELINLNLQTLAEKSVTGVGTSWKNSFS